MIGVVVYVGPIVAAALALVVGTVWGLRWVDRRDAAKTFILDFTPFTSDVAATEAELMGPGFDLGRTP